VITTTIQEETISLTNKQTCSQRTQKSWKTNTL